VNANGRYVVFETTANNLTSGDANSDMDVYLRDRKLGITERISIASDGSEGNDLTDLGYSNLDISADGRYVVFNSEGLKGNDGVIHNGIFLRDRKEKKTFWIANGFDPVMSADARFIVFRTDEKLRSADKNTFVDLYLYDRKNKKFELISVGRNGKSEGSTTYQYNISAINADGSVVAFATNNPALVSGDTNNALDVFVRNRNTGKTIRLTVNAAGQQANGDSLNPSISGDGRFVTFFSRATNLAASVTQANTIYLCRR
jgi:Tol biopolymer transport system component